MRTRPSENTTTRCHSVFSFRSPDALSRQLSAVPTDRFAIADPPAIALIVQRAFAIGRQSLLLERAYGGLVAQGIGIWLGVQAFINMGVNMGLLPTKGLTLPLLSFGGSGIVANCIAIAILLRVDYESRRLLRGFTV